MPTPRYTPCIAALALLLAGCDDAPPKPSPAATSSATAAASAAPPASAAAAASGSAKPYQGPTGTLTGIVRIEGDEAPLTHFQYEKECEGARGVYGKLFRVGLEGGLADALVAVTGYRGYLPPKDEVIEVTIKNCAYSARTIAMTDGQHLEVKNLDPLTSYVPHLDGARMPATIVAVPRGEPVKLYSRGPMRYWLRDQMGREFMVADVFHLRFSTFDVTGLDGRYRIEGIPVGKVQVNVLLPAANMKALNKEFVVKAGQNTLDLTLEFDAEKDVPKKKDDKTEGAKSPAEPKKSGSAPKAPQKG